MIDVGIFSEYSFLRRALVGCLLLAFSGAPLGVFLVLRRMSLMGDAVAHAILPGLAIGFLLSGLSVTAMSIGGIMAGLVVVVAVGVVTRFTNTREDSGFAAFYLMALALGVILVSMNGTPLDLFHLLFGSVLGIDDASLRLMLVVACITMLTLAIIYRPLVVESFDPSFMAAMRGRGGVYQVIFLILVVLNLVAGFQALGTLMSVGLMMLPAVAARFWTNRLFPLMAIAVLIAVLSSIGGLLASYCYNLPSGPAIILCAGGVYVFSLLLGTVGSVRTRYFPFRHLES